MNSAPACWHSKKQNNVETSSFGSECIAMKQSCEHIQGLTYKLRMMVITYEGSAYACSDNQSALANTTIPESTLKNKSSSLAYHLTRELIAMDD